MAGPLKRLIRDDRGTVAVLSAAMAVALFGLAALGVDLGRIGVDRGRAQSVADLAAIAAASDLARAVRAAEATVARNGLPLDGPVTVTLGTYRPDPGLAPDQRFRSPPVGAPNAARVTVDTHSAFVFARLVTGRERLAIRASATAASSTFASFAIGSRLAALDGGLANGLLSALLSTSVSLSVMDYQALADARIDLFRLLPALASRARLTAATYDEVLAAQVRLADMAAAMALSVPGGATSTAGRALSAMAQQLAGQAGAVPLAALASLGPYGGLPLGQTPAGGLAVSALDLISAAAQIAGGGRQVEAALGASLPGIAGASVKLAIGERPAGTSWVTVGQAGAEVHTAQTRLLLSLRLVGAGAIASVELPLYVELAAASARLTALACSFPDGARSSMTLAVTPGAVDAWIGAVSDAELRNMRTPPRPAAARLVNLPLLAVTGRAHVAVANMAPTPVAFSLAEAERRARKSVGTQDFTRALLTGLIGDLALDVSVLGLGLSLPGGPQQAVANILAAATPSIDRLLSGVLASLGLGLGQADVWALGLRCDGAVLVQ